MHAKLLTHATLVEEQTAESMARDGLEPDQGTRRAPLGHSKDSAELLARLPNHRPLFRRLHPRWYLRLALLCMGVLATHIFHKDFENRAREGFLQQDQTNATVAEENGVLWRSYLATRQARAKMSFQVISYNKKPRNVYIDLNGLLPRPRHLTWQNWKRLRSAFPDASPSALGACFCLLVNPVTHNCSSHWKVPMKLFHNGIPVNEHHMDSLPDETMLRVFVAPLRGALAE